MALCAFTLIACVGFLSVVSAQNCADSLSHSDSMSESLKYDVASACYVFLPSESMRVSLWNRFGAGSFTGIFMQVVDSQGTTSGTWSSDLSTTQCGGNANAVISKTGTKTAEDTTSFWTAPATCGDNEQFYIEVTVVKSFAEWTTARLLMVCKPDHSDAALMKQVRPPFKSLYCSQGSWAIIPSRASEGFETGLPRGGWRHFYGAAGLRFERVMSPAEGSSSTMPQASKGSYYLYYKAKGTNENDMAGLLSPFGIQGCFCLSFDCYMDTDGVTRFTLSSIGAVQAQLLDVTEVTDFWRSVDISITSVKPVLLAFQVFNSGVQTGGVGLDNIMFKAGPCGGDALVADLTSPSDP